MAVGCGGWTITLLVCFWHTRWWGRRHALTRPHARPATRTRSAENHPQTPHTAPPTTDPAEQSPEPHPTPSTSLGRLLLLRPPMDMLMPECLSPSKTSGRPPATWSSWNTP